MARAADVIADAEQEAANNVSWYWEGFPSQTGMDDWSRGNVPIDAVGATAGESICCFDYPMKLAAQRNYLSQQQVNDIYQNIIVHRKDDAGVLSYYGYTLSVWQDWPTVPGGLWRPRRGDLVFFNCNIGGDLAHVALACGSTTPAGHAEVVSFGEGAAAAGLVTVTRTTVEAIKAIYVASLVNVKFTQPIWA